MTRPNLSISLFSHLPRTARRAHGGGAGGGRVLLLQCTAGGVGGHGVGSLVIPKEENGRMAAALSYISCSSTLKTGFRRRKREREVVSHCW